MHLPGFKAATDKRECLLKGVIAGLVAGLAGGLPSLLMLDRQALHESIRSIANLVPGNRFVKSSKGRWLLGANAHMSISVAFATLYVCLMKRRPLLYGTAIWAVAYKGLGPKAMKEQDKSKALADHLLWAVIVDRVSHLSFGHLQPARVRCLPTNDAGVEQHG